MPTTITGHHIEVTDGMKSAVNKKVEKLSKHYPDLASIKVYLTVERHEQIAEATTHYLGKDFTAKAKNGDLYQAINGMADKLEALLHRHKEKVKSHSHEKPIGDQTSPDEEAVA